MSLDQITISVILLGVLLMFAWGRWRHDLVAMSALVLCALFGLVPVPQAFSGFSHPAVVTVATVLIISHALKNSGVVTLAASRLGGLTRKPLMHIGILTLIVTVASAFMNNVGALALLLPIATATASEHQRSPAVLLMPLAFGSILGGMTTMIGTPPNIIVASFRADLPGEQAFGLFDFSPVGIPVAIAGVLFVVFIGWRLLPRERLEKNIGDQLFKVGDYLAELRITAESDLIGRNVPALIFDDEWDLLLVGIAHENSRARPLSTGHRFKQNDVLIVHGKAEELQPLIDRYRLELLSAPGAALQDVMPSELALFEGIVSSDSPLVGRGSAYLRKESAGRVALFGLSRHGEVLRNRLRRVQFRIGDILLLQGREEEIDEHISRFGLLPLAPRTLTLGQRQRALTALLVFAGAIALGLLNLMPLYLAFLIAIFLFLLLGILPVRRLYDEVDWPVIVLLGAMIPVGQALETTGTTTLLANSIAGWTEGWSVVWVLALLLVVTMFLSDIINNAATVLVMAPIAVSLSSALAVNTEPFLMAVAVGASCAFLTPIGHQSNTLVMGPGGYKFGDYWRMGLPLEMIIVVLSVPLILWAWPL
ncbi:MAG: SLC13 family permease [Gammaproteobacteria bacterium]|jgi:di/tricarboxylate transporter